MKALPELYKTARVAIAASDSGDTMGFCQACIVDGTMPDPMENPCGTDRYGDGRFTETLEERLEELISRKFSRKRRMIPFSGLVGDGSATGTLTRPIISLHLGLCWFIQYCIASILSVPL